MGAFQTTRWSLILASRDETRDGAAALDQLCRIYRSPVLAYVRHHGHGPDDAEELTQSFFAYLLDREMVHRADPARGSFRAFLVSAIRHFLSDARSADRALKRGGDAVRVSLEDHDPAGSEADTPEAAFDRAFALTVLARAMAGLEREARAAGKAELFAALKPFLVESPDPDEYAAVALRFGQRRNTVAVAIHRLRERLRQLVRAELAETAGTDEQVDEEMKALGGRFGSAV